MAEVFKIEVETSQLNDLLEKIREEGSKNKLKTITSGVSNNNGKLLNDEDLKVIQHENKLRKETIKNYSSLNIALHKSTDGLSSLFEKLKSLPKKIGSAGKGIIMTLLTGAYGLFSNSRAMNVSTDARALNISAGQALGLNEAEEVVGTNGKLKEILDHINDSLYSFKHAKDFTILGMNREELLKMNGIERLESVLKTIQNSFTRHADGDPNKEIDNRSIDEITGGNRKFLSARLDNLGSNGHIKEGNLDKILNALNIYTNKHNSEEIKKREASAFEFNKSMVDIKSSLTELAVAASPAIIKIIHELTELFKLATPNIEKAINATREFFKNPFENIMKGVGEGLSSILKTSLGWVANFFADLFKSGINISFNNNQQKQQTQNKNKIKVDIHVHDKNNNIKKITSTQEGQLNHALIQGVN